MHCRFIFLEANCIQIHSTIWRPRSSFTPLNADKGVLQTNLGVGESHSGCKCSYQAHEHCYSMSQWFVGSCGIGRNIWSAEWLSMGFLASAARGNHPIAFNCKRQDSNHMSKSRWTQQNIAWVMFQHHCISTMQFEYPKNMLQKSYCNAPWRLGSGQEHIHLLPFNTPASFEELMNTLQLGIDSLVISNHPGTFIVLLDEIPPIIL